MKHTEISYSTLVTADNVCAHLKRVVPRIHKKVRTSLLEPHKLKFDNLLDIGNTMRELITKIEQLEPGTLFSVGSLVISSNKTNAQVLGRELKSVEGNGRALVVPCFKFVSAYPGKYVYERLKMREELVKDFNILLSK